jgi:hypothetical protein
MEEAAGEADEDRHRDRPCGTGDGAPGGAEDGRRRAHGPRAGEAGVERGEDEQREEQDERGEEDVGGQRVGVKATVDTSQIQTDPLADGFDKGLANLTYFLDIFSPLREQLSEESGGTYDAASARLEGSPAAGAKTGTATGPRVLGFEQILASDYNEDKFPAPGEWYVSLNAADTATFPADVPAELPVELEVQVIGRAQPSSADFAKALPGPQKQPPASPDTSSGPERLFAATEQSADPALTLALVAVLALLGGLILGTLAIVVLGLGRRRA